MSGNDSSGDCYDEYNAASYTAVAALRAGVGVFSAACCLAVIILIAVYKKYTVFCQRLILNLAIAAFIHSLSYPLARVNYYSELRVENPYCNFGSLLNLYSSWAELLALMCIVTHLFIGGVLGLPTQRYEPAFWVLPYTLPMLWVWVPYIGGSYGTSGAWCGIRVVNEDCSSFRQGQILQFTTWYIPLYILLFITCIISLVVAVKVWRDTKRWSGLYDSEIKTKRERVQKEITPLLWFPAIYLILNTFSLIDRVYHAAKPNDPIVELTYLHTLTSPFRGAFVALVFALVDPATRRRLKWRYLVTACRENCGNSLVQEYPVQKVERGESLSIKLSPTSVAGEKD